MADLFPEDAEALAAQRARWADHDADFTPPDVARLGAWAVREYITRRPRCILGPCAGAGPWLAAAREAWPRAVIAGMDIREEERPHLTHHVGELARIGDFLTTEPPIEPDLILDNLPFKYALEFMARGLEVLAPGGVAVWFVRMTLGDADLVNDFFKANPFAHQLEYVDRFKFRVGINPATGKRWGSDSTGYKLIGFEKNRRPDCFIGRRLPSLLPESRRWRKTLSGVDIRPGTEYLYPDAEPSAWTMPG